MGKGIRSRFKPFLFNRKVLEWEQAIANILNKYTEVLSKIRD